MRQAFDIYLMNSWDQLPAETWEKLGLQETSWEDLNQANDVFLNQNFPTRYAAAIVLRVLEAHGARGSVVDARYREPQVTLEQAQRLAAQEIDRIIELRERTKPRVEFDPLEFHSEHPMYWVFLRSSPTLIEEGYVPGALFASIDKLDGHAWATAEFDRLAEEQAALSKG